MDAFWGHILETLWALLNLLYLLNVCVNAFVSQIHIYRYFWSVLHSRFFEVPGCSLDSNCFLLREGEFRKNGTEKVKNKKGLAKERRRKGETDFEQFHLKQQLDTIEESHHKHTIEDQGGSWATPLEKLFGCCF